MDRGVALSLAKKKQINEKNEKKKFSPTKITQRPRVPHETVRQELFHRNNLHEPKKRGPKPKKTEIIFSDEKKFRYDKPDGWAYYWYSLDEKDDDSLYNKDQGKFKGVMVHATISSAGILSLDRLQGSITADVWLELLPSKILPSIHNAHGKQFKYQIDNASCYKNKETLKDLEIENIWSFMVRKVYVDLVNYENEEDLQAEIQRAGRKITKKDILPLINSFKKRLTELLKRGGKNVQ
ncbi:MAG: hypothetical protein EZS28_044229 [Streblomastix strix]|uniref:Tc1-like transposase DDE domain-containing protein n=1 Tax=Streblomastix strix TaxID=222440 RepID=A0A5J4TP39_9EUKA|nr:MAG: hypothetical protein EZS28_044229 [Streblomastix strix]